MFKVNYPPDETNLQLGWVKQMELVRTDNLIDVSAFSSLSPSFISGLGTVELNLSIQVVSTQGLQHLLHNWAYEGISQPTPRKEFMCLHCVSPNPIINTHCSQCGAPRSFILG